jgi:uncharacterized LabA/DUF88 family protein
MGGMKMSLVELYFNVVDYDVLLKITNITKVSINGFKNPGRVPEKILRKAVSLKFSSSIVSFKNIINDIYGQNLEEFKKDNVDDFIYGFLSYPCRDNVPFHVALGMLILTFPEFAEKNLDKFNENINSGRHIFEGCAQTPDITEENCFVVMDKVLQIAEGVEWFEVSIPNMEKRLEIINKFDDYKMLTEKLKDYDLYRLSLEFEEMRKDYPDYLPLAAFLSSNIEKIKKSDADTKSFYNKLVFNVYGCISVETLVEVERKTLLKDKDVESLQIKIKENEKHILQLEKDIESLNDRIKEYEKSICDELELNSGMRTIEDGVVEQVASVVIGDCETIIITSLEWDRVFDVLGRCCIIHPENLNMLEEAAKSFEGIIFIDRNSIKNTRDLIEIEKRINRMNKRRAVVLGSSPPELVRNIIFKKSRLEEQVI